MSAAPRGSELRRCGVVGDPIAHSLSPVLHRAAYAALRLDGFAYDAHRVGAGALAGFVAGLDPSWRGLSVTAPLKREALALASTRTAVADAAGGANTLVFTDEGPLADNTDVPGAVAALLERGVEGVGEATILGGGATATSMAIALAELGARRLTLLVRSAVRAQESAEAIRRAVPDVPLGVLELGAAPAPVGDVVVSTVPVSAQEPALVERLARAQVVFDVVYDPWPTALAAATVDAGGVVVNGLDLLVHQALAQLELFVGASPAADVLRDAGLAALSQGDDED